jgi:hypothetical protein
MDAEIFIEMAEDANQRVRSYSGRGMYGKYCVGISTDGADEVGVLGEIAEQVADESLRDLIELFATGARIDQMGRGNIVYFPSLKWPEGREDSDNDDSDD